MIVSVLPSTEVFACHVRVLLECGKYCLIAGGFVEC